MHVTEQQLLEAGAEQALIPEIIRLLSSDKSPKRIWEHLCEHILHPDTSYTLLQLLHQFVFDYDETSDAIPMAYWPAGQLLNQSNIFRVCNRKGMDYTELHKWSVTDKRSFWKFIIEELQISFKKPFDQIADFSSGIEAPHWLKGAVFNIADSCFKKGNEHKTALVFQTEDGRMDSWSYQELDELSNRVANGLADMGLKKGDAIAIDMPMIAESVAIYLGIVKMGGAVVSIADSLAASEVDKRLQIADAKALFTQDLIIRSGKELPLYGKLDKNTLPATILIPAKHTLSSKLRDQDVEWKDFLSNQSTHHSADCSPSDVCNILFSSGTTGDPKAIPWTHTTPIKCAADGYLHHDLHAGDVVAWPTNIGWMMGPWLIFASLINECTIALYYGSPVERGFGEFVQNARVNMLGLVPSMVKKWIETDCMKGLNWEHIKLYSSTGESSNPQDYLWLMCRAGWKPVIEYCGGTEIGGGYFTGTVVQPASPSTFSTAALGIDIIILDDQGNPSDTGELFIIPPSIGLSDSLLNKNHHDVYYSDLPEVKAEYVSGMGVSIKEQFLSTECEPLIRRHGDEVQRLPNGYFRALGRADDTMNLGGIKTSSVEIERILDLTEGVTETAAISVQPKAGGPGKLVIYAVLNEGVQTEKNALKKQFQRAIKSFLNPLFHIHEVEIVEALPRTASNKVMRRMLREQYIRSAH